MMVYWLKKKENGRNSVCHNGSTSPSTRFKFKTNFKFTRRRPKEIELKKPETKVKESEEKTGM